MNKYHKMEKVEFEGDLILLIIDGKEYQFKIADISRKLANANDTERGKFQISPSGYGIHWPLIDEDLSIDGLIGVKHYPSKIHEEVTP